MKKQLHIIVALVTLIVAASCQKELAEAVSDDVVIYTVTIGDALDTKAVDGDKNSVNQLVYEVWKTSATKAEDMTLENSRLFSHDVIDDFKESVSVPVRIIRQQNFYVLFWAHNSEGAYDAGNLMEVSLKNSLSANQLNYTAFAGTKYLSSEDELSEKTVRLDRIVSQLNIVTDKDGLKLGNVDNAGNVTVKSSSIKVKGLSKTFNVAGMKVGAVTDEVIEYKSSDLPGGISYNNDYTYVSMNYLGFIPKNGTNVDVEYCMTYKIDDSETTISNTVSNVPLKPNYRTNILGNLLSAEADYKVTLNKGFEATENNQAEGLEKISDGVYKISSANGLSYASEHLFADGGTFYIAEGLDMNNTSFSPADIPSGVELILTGGSIQTKSEQTSPVTISNLRVTDTETAALLGNVSGTVRISNIRITDSQFTSEGSAAAFVANAAGSVVIENCAVVRCVFDGDKVGALVGTASSEGAVSSTGNKAYFNTTAEGDDVAKAVGEGSDDVSVDSTPEVGSDQNGAYEVTDSHSLAWALETADPSDGQEIVKVKVAADIDMTSTMVIPSGRTVELDLNGKTVSSISTATGSNYNMLDVRGTLTVKNGTITTKHTGENMGWNNSTNVFNVTDGGVLNLESVVAKNLGGSDMAFVAHLNNWGEVTLNVTSSTLESIYIAVRVFNSGNDMNNVTIENSTLKGKYAFWVHNYTAVDFGTQDKADAHAKLLNFDIFGNNNQFIGQNDTPILYGFDDAVYFEADGSPVLQSVANLKWFANYINTGNNFKDKTAKLAADIDLAGAEWIPIGTKNNHFHGTFDGQGHTISNFKITQKHDGDNAQAALFGTVSLTTVFKNFNIDNIQVLYPADYNGDYYGAAVIGTFYGNVTLQNINVTKSTIQGNNKVAGLIAHDGSSSNVLIENCNVNGCTIETKNEEDGGNVGGLVGLFQNTEATVKNCSVIGCTINAINSSDSGKRGNALLIGGTIDATPANLYVKIDNCMVADNTFNETGRSKYVSPYGDGKLVGGAREGDSYVIGKVEIDGVVYPNN